MDLSGNGRCLVGGSRRTRCRWGGATSAVPPCTLPCGPRVGGKFVLGASHSRWLERHVPRPVRCVAVMFVCLLAASWRWPQRTRSSPVGTPRRLWHTSPRQSTTERARPGADVGEFRRRCGRVPAQMWARKHARRGCSFLVGHRREQRGGGGGGGGPAAAECGHGKRRPRCDHERAWQARRSARPHLHQDSAPRAGPGPC
jgi:hypothetical protein